MLLFGLVLLVHLLHQHLLVADFVFKLVSLGEVIHDLRDLVLLDLVVVFFLEMLHLLLELAMHLLYLAS